MPFNSLRLRQNRCHFADDIFKCNLFNENVWIPIKISLKFVPKGPINNFPALVQIMAWRRTGDKPLSEPMMTQFNNTYIHMPLGLNELTHLPLDKMATISQMIFPDAFSWMEIFLFRLKFHWSLFLRRRIGDKPLSEPMLMQFSDAYMRH